jgi:hypothetical protein
MARRADEYGVETGRAITVDMKRVKAPKDEIVAQSRTSAHLWTSANYHRWGVGAAAMWLIAGSSG